MVFTHLVFTMGNFIIAGHYATNITNSQTIKKNFNWEGCSLTYAIMIVAILLLNFF